MNINDISLLELHFLDDCFVFKCLFEVFKLRVHFNSLKDKKRHLHSGVYLEDTSIYIYIHVYIYFYK